MVYNLNYCLFIYKLSITIQFFNLTPFHINSVHLIYLTWTSITKLTKSLQEFENINLNLAGQQNALEWSWRIPAEQKKKPTTRRTPIWTQPQKLSPKQYQIRKKKEKQKPLDTQWRWSVAVSEIWKFLGGSGWIWIPYAIFFYRDWYSCVLVHPGKFFPNKEAMCF